MKKDCYVRKYGLMLLTYLAIAISIVVVLFIFFPWIMLGLVAIYFVFIWHRIDKESMQIPSDEPFLRDEFPEN